MEVELDFSVAPPSPTIGSFVGAAPKQMVVMNSDTPSREALSALKLGAPRDDKAGSLKAPSSFISQKASAARLASATNSPSEAQQYHISLVSLNACLWPWGLRQSIHDNYKLQRAKGIAELCKKYDIVCLQEVFTSSWDGQWPKVLESEHLNYVRADGREMWHALDTGLQVISRHKIISSQYHPFTSTGGLARFFKPFGYLHCVIELPAVGGRVERFHVFNCHLHPDEGHYGPSSPLEIRFEQAQEISSKVPKDAPWIIAGDFNIHAHDKDGEKLHQFFIHESEDGPKKASRYAPERATIHNLVPFAVHRPDMLHMSVDHIYSRNTITEGYLHEELAHLSDHLPVSVKISIM